VLNSGFGESDEIGWVLSFGFSVVDRMDACWLLLECVILEYIFQT
jgi:hypothetical protein